MKNTHGLLRDILAAIGGCLIVVSFTAMGQNTTDGFSLAPGILIDPGNRIAYVMTPRSRVESINLEDGEVVWSTLAAAKPIAIRDERIIAQVESVEATSTLTLAALDAKNGELVNSESIELGSDVISSIDDGKEHRFAIGTENIDTKTGSVLWRYNYQKISGPEADLSPVVEFFGALDVDAAASITRIDGGGFNTQSGKPPYRLPRVLRPISEKPPSDRIILDLESGLRYRLDGIQVPPPSGVSPDTTTVKNPSSGLILTEGLPGDEFPITRRIPGDQFGHSVDDRYVVASTFTGDIEAAEPYRWTIYERGTFEIVASFVAQTSLAPFVVIGGHVIYIRQPYQRREGGKLQSYPLSLVARDAESGRLVWTHAIRDTRYTGMVPVQVR